MAKWSGVIGFEHTREISPGIYTPTITECKMTGDLLRVSRRLQSDSSVNDSIVLSNEISIVRKPYIEQNMNAIRYASFNGSKWKVTNVTVQHPRLVLSLGGIYNESA